MIAYSNQLKNYFLFLLILFIRIQWTSHTRMMNDDDDFFGGGSQSVNQDYIVEQRSTDRLLADITAGGFRDGRQKFMEDEKHLQLGFDLAYRLMCKTAFIVGKIKSFSIYSNVAKGNTAFLARLNQKLETIEKYTFELFLNWSASSKSSDNVEPSFECLIQCLAELENKLGAYASVCLNSGDFMADRFLEGLNLSSEMITNQIMYENSGEIKEVVEEEKLTGINKLINDLKFDF